MADLVPRQIRGRYFSQRNRFAGGFAIGVSLLGGIVLDFFREKDSAYDGYLALFLLACTAGLAAFFFLGKQPEPPQADPQPLPLLAPISAVLFRTRTTAESSLFIWRFSFQLEFQLLTSLHT